MCNAFVAFALCQSLFPIAFRIEMNWYNFHSLITIANDSYQLLSVMLTKCIVTFAFHAYILLNPMRFSAMWNCMS